MFLFEPENKRILVPAPPGGDDPANPQTVMVQELINEIREWEASPEGMAYPHLIVSDGKTSMLGGRYTGLTYTLLNNWRIKFEDRPGLPWVRCWIRGGNSVALNIYGNDPIEPSSYVTASYEQDTSVSLIEGTGADPSAIADAVWDEVRSEHITDGTYGNVSEWAGTGGGLTSEEHDQLMATSIETTTKSLKECNTRRIIYKATVENPIRKVAIGMLDKITLEIKNDTDSDWSAPIDSKTLYYWYETIGDKNPIKVGEDG